MKIAFVTTQSTHGSTLQGRVIPIATHMAQRHDIHILAHSSQQDPSGNAKKSSPFQFHEIGKNPFTHTHRGKKRLNGWRLATRMMINTIRTLGTLVRVQPDSVIIVKPLPQNVLAVRIWKLFNPNRLTILDVDDFELTANKLSSTMQRIPIHWSERTGARIAKKIVAATPFLQDHFNQLVARRKPVTLVPTGISDSLLDISHTPADAPPTITYMGSISISSGHRVDMLPTILKNVRNTFPDTRMIIAGTGDDRAFIEEEFNHLGLGDAVTFTGRFNNTTIPDIIAKTTILIDPIDSSITNRAKSTFRVALAAATGTPIVSGNIGIRPMLLPETLHDRFFSKSNNIQSYTQHLKHILQEPLTPRERQSMKDHAVQFTWTQLAPKFEQICSE